LSYGGAVVDDEEAAAMEAALASMMVESAAMLQDTQPAAEPSPSWPSSPLANGRSTNAHTRGGGGGRGGDVCNDVFAPGVLGGGSGSGVAAGVVTRADAAAASGERRERDGGGGSAFHVIDEGMRYQGRTSPITVDSSGETMFKTAGATQRLVNTAAAAAATYNEAATTSPTTMASNAAMAARQRLALSKQQQQLRGRAGDSDGRAGGFAVLDLKPGQRVRVRPQPRRTRL